MCTCFGLSAGFLSGMHNIHTHEINKLELKDIEKESIKSGVCAVENETKNQVINAEINKTEMLYFFHFDFLFIKSFFLLFL